MKENISIPQFVRSFGRIKSRTLSNNKKDLLANLLPKYQINNSASILQSPKIYLEIGFGFGDFLFENAKNNPEILFIGCEPHINGVVNLLAKLQKEPLENIKIFVGDNRLLLSTISKKIFDKIYILFPDPWPKTKHNKRRLINIDFFQLLHSKIKNTGKLIVATDDNSYKKWILAEYFRSDLWQWHAKSKVDWQNFPNSWIKTKYQIKAEVSGRENIYLEFIPNSIFKNP
jgi:tRNA (guanine-N7-)-methyltransferase